MKINLVNKKQTPKSQHQHTPEAIETKEKLNSISITPSEDNMTATEAAVKEAKAISPNQYSTWKIGSTSSSILLNGVEGKNSPLQKINGKNNDKNSKVFTAGINSNDYVPTLSSLSNIGTEGVQTRQQFSSTGKSLFQDSLLNQPSSSVEAVLAAACDALDFDIAEVWLRTGPKTHQLINSHLRPAALENSVRKELVDVYYGEKSSERTHRLSPALCKRAKEAKDVVWVTTQTEMGAETLRISINDVRTAVAVPVCHETSNTNITFIYFSMRRCGFLY